MTTFSSLPPLIMFWWKSFLLFCPPNLKGLFRVLGQPWTEKPRLVIPLNSRSKKSSPVSWIFSFSFPSVHFHIFGLCLLLWLYSSWPSTSCFSFPFFLCYSLRPTHLDRPVCMSGCCKHGASIREDNTENRNHVLRKPLSTARFYWCKAHLHPSDIKHNIFFLCLRRLWIFD